MSHAAAARLFVAVDPPAEVSRALAAWARTVAAELRGAGSPRFVDAASMHLTLCFLGNRPVAEIGALAAALEPCAAAVGECSLGAPVLLPPRRPRALAVEVCDDAHGLAHVHGLLVCELARACGWEPPRGRLRPHITVARLGRGARGAGVPAFAEPTPQLSFTPPSLSLYRSRLDPAGARYEELARCALGRER